jgi:excisionase family DNA binding protein
MASEIEKTQKLLTVAQVAERIGQSRFSVYRKIEAGTIPAIRLGDGNAALRVRESELERWLNE